MKKYIISLLVIALSLLISCQKDSSESEGRAEISELTTQGLTTANWADDDKVGIYVVKTGLDFTGNLIGGADNRQFVYNTGKLAPKDATQKIIVNNISKFDVVAYAPYLATGTAAGEIKDFKYPVDISSQPLLGMKSIDLLYSNNMKNMSSEMGSSLMRFDHALSRLNIKVRSSVLTAVQLKGLTLQIMNTPIKAEFNLQTGVFDAQVPVYGPTQAGLVVDGSVYEVLLIPINLEGAYFHVETIANGEFQFNITNWDIIESGKDFDVILNLDRGGNVEVVENVINSWAPWRERDLIDITDKFTDEAFKAWVVRNVCNIPTAVSVADARILLGDVNKVKTINIDALAVGSGASEFSTFAGLEYFTELKHFNISNVNVAAGNLSLYRLPDSMKRSGTSISITNMSNLAKILNIDAESVVIENNDVLENIDLSTSGRSIMRSLRVVGNGELIARIIVDTGACTSLESFVCMGNYPLENIDISTSTKIKALQLGDNSRAGLSDVFYVDLWEGVNIYDLPAMYPFFSHYEGDTWTTIYGHKVTVEYLTF